MKLELKLVKIRKDIPSYHIVVAKKRSASNSRLDKVGFFHFSKKYHPGFYRKKSIKLLGINFQKMKKYLSQGASIHKNVLKILAC